MVFIWAGKDGERSPEQETGRDGAWQERGGDGGRGRVCAAGPSRARRVDP